MLQKTIILKYIKLLVFSCLLSFTGLKTFAQKVKIDGVAVVVGKHIVLDSDIEKFKLEVEVKSEGKVKITDCEMLEELMLQKLLSHHAILDSIEVSDEEVSSRVENSINYFKQESGGSIEKVIETFDYDDIEGLKEGLANIQRENLLVEKEQAKITEKVDLTPEEVRLYYNGLKEKGELPKFPAEIELAQIVIKSIPTEEENNEVIARLEKIKKDIEEGANFKIKAIVNSDDPAVISNGGRYTITKNSSFIRRFKEVAFTLDVGQVSKPFKSTFGYHIMQLHKIKGDTRIVSHILIQPSVSDEKIRKVKEKAERVSLEIREGKITFEEAVKKYSDDEETKNNGGLIFNPYTGESGLDLTRMDPALYARVSDLKKGEITEPFYDEERSGVKMYKFILIKNRTEAHTADFIDDYVKIQQLALQKKKEEAIAKWSREKIKDTHIKIRENYKKCVFNKNWKKKFNK